MGGISMEIKKVDEKRMKKYPSDRGVLLIINPKDKAVIVNFFNILWERHKVASRIEAINPFQPHLFNEDIHFWVGDFKKVAKKVIIVSINNNPHRNEMIEGSTNRNILRLNLKSEKDINFAIIKVRLVFFMLSKILDERRWIL